MVPHLSKDKNEFKECDQHVVGIILFPHVDIDHETEWDHPLWVESYMFLCWLVVGWLLNVPATGWCISGTDLLRQFDVLPH